MIDTEMVSTEAPTWVVAVALAAALLLFAVAIAVGYRLDSMVATVIVGFLGAFVAISIAVVVASVTEPPKEEARA